MKSNILVLDWSNLAFRSLFMAAGPTVKLNYNLKEEIEAFIGKMAQDLASIVRTFNPDRLVIATDSKHSWRKDVYPEYKSNREENKDKEKNWDNIYAALNSFQAHLKSKGLIFIECPHAEADDLMAEVKEIVFNEPAFANCNLTIVSTDADIRQLIDFKKETEQYCVVFKEIADRTTKKKSLFCNQEMYDWYTKKDEMGIFNMTMHQDKDRLYNFLSQNKVIQLEVTDPDSILLTKVFCGDDGDSVPAFCHWYGSTGKMVRVTKTKLDKIRESMSISKVSEVEQRKDELKEHLEAAIKREVNDIDVPERLERQRVLVELNSSLFPREIALYKADIIQTIIKGQRLDFSNLKMSDLLTGSEFSAVLQRDRAKDADIFKGIKKEMEKYTNEYMEKLW